MRRNLLHCFCFVFVLSVGTASYGVAGASVRGSVGKGGADSAVQYSVVGVVLPMPVENEKEVLWKTVSLLVSYCM